MHGDEPTLDTRRLQAGLTTRPETGRTLEASALWTNTSPDRFNSRFALVTQLRVNSAEAARVHQWIEA